MQRLKQESGAVLLTVLWVIMGLMVISAIVIQNADLEVLLTKNYKDRIHSYTLAKYGVDTAFSRLLDGDESLGFTGEFDGGIFDVIVTPEDGKININAFGEEVLSALPDMTSSAVRYILDRRRTAESKDTIAMLLDIRELGVIEGFTLSSKLAGMITTYGRYNINSIEPLIFDGLLLSHGVDEIKAMFITNELIQFQADAEKSVSSIEDLYKFLPNMEPDIYDRIKHLVSVEGTININSASFEVIQTMVSILKIEVSVEDLITKRETEPFADMEELREFFTNEKDYKEFRSHFCTESSFFRIISKASYGKLTPKAEVEAVVYHEKDAGLLEILSFESK